MPLSEKFVAPACDCSTENQTALLFSLAVTLCQPQAAGLLPHFHTRLENKKGTRHIFKLQSSQFPIPHEPSRPFTVRKNKAILNAEHVLQD